MELFKQDVYRKTSPQFMSVRGDCVEVISSNFLDVQSAIFLFGRVVECVLWQAIWSCNDDLTCLLLLLLSSMTVYSLITGSAICLPIYFAYLPEELGLRHQSHWDTGDTDLHPFNQLLHSLQ